MLEKNSQKGYGYEITKKTAPDIYERFSPSEEDFNFVFGDKLEREDCKIVLCAGFERVGFEGEEYGVTQRIDNFNFDLNKSGCSVVNLALEKRSLFQQNSNDPDVVEISDPNTFQDYINQQINQNLTGVSKDESVKLQLLISGHGKVGDAFIRNGLGQKFYYKTLIASFSNAIATQMKDGRKVKVELKFDFCDSSQSDKIMDVLTKGEFNGNEVQYKESSMTVRGILPDAVPNAVIEVDESFLEEDSSNAAQFANELCQHLKKEHGIKLDEIKVKGATGIMMTSGVFIVSYQTDIKKPIVVMNVKMNQKSIVDIENMNNVEEKQSFTPMEKQGEHSSAFQNIANVCTESEKTR